MVHAKLGAARNRTTQAILRMVALLPPKEESWSGTVTREFSGLWDCDERHRTLIAFQRILDSSETFCGVLRGLKPSVDEMMGDFPNLVE